MKRITVAVLGAAIVAAIGTGVAARRADDQAARPAPQTARPASTSTKPAPPATAAPAQPAAATTKPVAAHAAPAQSPGAAAAAEQTAVVKQYCVGCHNDRTKSGQLTLAAFDAATITKDPTLGEKMIRKLRAGMMPPAGAKRPEPAVLEGLAQGLETRIDRAAALNPMPGWRPFQRLNRAEYARAVKDLLDVDVDVTALLPADTISDGFDNIADAQAFSATLLAGYLRAAGKVTMLAVGDPNAVPTESAYRVPKTASQLRRVDGAPLGTRGGISVVHTFPADGDYVFRMELHSNACGVLFGGPMTGEKIEVSIDGERVALLDIDSRMTEVTTGLSLKTPVVHVAAGPRRVSAAFLQQFEGPVVDIMAPIDHTLADTQIGVALGITTLPHLKDLYIVGPKNVTGVSDTVSRRKVFTCRPTTPGEETPCARDIIRRLASQAFRGPVSGDDLTALLSFYNDGRKDGDFESAIASAIEAILASPQFLFRVEPVPATARAGSAYRIGDRELASRMSFFLWGTAPDDELMQGGDVWRAQPARRRRQADSPHAGGSGDRKRSRRDSRRSGCG